MKSNKQTMCGIDSRISLTERMVKSVTIGLTCLLDSVPRRNDNIVQYYDQASGCCAFHPNEEKKIQLARDKHSLRMTHNGNEYENDQFVIYLFRLTFCSIRLQFKLFYKIKLR